ncbi:acetylornithine aminotransferase [Amylibacter marinus]|uniref:Acetylornithine aminotransferase n=1 Tax=Amylibacter marinus TaxID=1475483 RepID=A0ABQ5VU89_9RHOB|nr:aspartate aminotransferase family protein [Amylibacter marinus]GLQ34899.1 acetylornithine aminotransferase [Amylibacter marinus]
MISSVLPTYARAPLSFVKGEGSWLMDSDNRRYLDMGAGIAVNILGHANPVLADALKSQADTLWHTSNLYNVPNQTALADRLVDATFADTVFFTNSGTESMECAVKMARKFHHENGAPERVNMIAFNGAFHGRSLGMISAAGAEKLTAGFGPLLPGFTHVDFADLDAVEAAVDETTAAIIVEPVQGEGGIVPAEDAFLRGLRELCDAQGILLILDEIQCGMGRSGKLFAHEWAGITPDIMAVAKGIGGGFPLGACLATERAASGMVAGTHGSTYGGNPLATAVGSAVLDVVNTPAFLQEVTARAGEMRQGLEGLVASHPDVFKSVRGVGLMLGVECVVPNMDVVNAGYEASLLTVPGGGNVIRLLPALNITSDEIKQALACLEKTAQLIEAKL